MLAKKSGALMPYLILLAAALIFFREVLFGSGYVIPWDFRYFHYPLATFIADALRAGHLPLWDPYTYCGRPVFADPQAQLFYPPTFITIVLSNIIGGDHLFYLLEWQLVLHVFQAGAFTYALLRNLGLTTAAALLGGLGFELSGFFASQTQHLGAIDAAAWLPLAVFSVLVLAPSSKWKGIAGIGVSIAMSLLAGFPAVSITVLLTTLLLALVRRVLWPALGGVALAAFLGAVQLIPAMQLTSLSVAKYRTEWVMPGGLPLQSLVSLVSPNHYGIFDLHQYRGQWNPTFLYIYCGIAGIVLAVGASIARPHKLVPPLIGLAFLSAVWMLGTSTPAGAPLFYLTGRYFDGSVYPHYGLVVFNFSVALLAGFGAAHLLPKEWMRYAAAGVLAVDLIYAGSGRPFNTASLAEEPGITRQSIDGSSRLLQTLRSELSGQAPPYRFDTNSDTVALSMMGPLTGTPTANGYSPMALARYIQVRLLFANGYRWGAWYEIENLRSQIPALLNVRCLITRRLLDEQIMREANLRYVTADAGHYVYAQTDVLPRFFAVHRTVKAASLADAVQLARDPTFDFGTAAIVEGDAAVSAGETQVRVARYDLNDVRLRVSGNSSALLVTSEANYPGWEATMDGRRVPIVNTNIAFRGVAVPPGDHEVRFRFAPVTLAIGASISAVAWVGLGLSLLRKKS